MEFGIIRLMKINGRYLAIAFSLGVVLIIILLTRHDTEQTAARGVVASGLSVGAEVFATDERLDELRQISVSAAMNDNRLAAARLLKTYER